MALPYFYEPAITTTATPFTLGEETSKHCVQVLRMKQGEQLQLTDGKGNLYTTTLISPDKKHATVQVNEQLQQPAHERKLAIGISLLKNASRFEWFLEKATEIGASEIIPLLCHRTERQHFRYDRMNNILIAAMLQSQQSWLPFLHEPVNVASYIEAGIASQKLIAHCEENIKTPVQQVPLTNNVAILIGPEGDFTPEEIALATGLGFQPVSLGDTRLRTETAGIVAATLIMNI